MVDVSFENSFKKTFSKINDELLKLKIKKQIKKIVKTPNIGKPMRNVRKGTREVYVSPFRISYIFLDVKKEIIFLEIYHKDKQ
ncbi:hypothetical protein C0585_05270 [Candidatus Woesearchaeota archaeon]|nr:MAG: hypothetical protein C0585_05270 [Candidatus Woesearchaeota archaeon]